jgi:hypothetical protein
MDSFDVHTRDIITAILTKIFLQKLQRAIAEARGYSADRALPGHGRKTSFDTSYRTDDSAAENADSRKPPSGAPATGSAGTKRKYRRHPKACRSYPVLA